MEITARLVKELRDASGAGMMDAKKALIACNGVMEDAVDWLRTKGLAKAAKKADRVASDGLIGVYKGEMVAVAVEINSETDFVAKNQDFQRMVREITASAVNVDNIEALSQETLDGKKIENVIADHIAVIGEKLSLRRMVRFSGSRVTTYVHNSVDKGLGSLAVLVSYDGDDENLARQVAMHIAACNPVAISKDDLNPALIEREKNIFIQQARESGKPENIIDSMVNGRMKKFFDEVTLLSQKFVIDPEISVGEALDRGGISITNFARIAVGEGIEKDEENFADEVAKTIGS